MFMSLVDYIRAYLNLTDFEVNGRYVVEIYDDGHGREVRVELWDREPQVVHRPDLESVYKEK
jgi:hypothetical protein